MDYETAYQWLHGDRVEYSGCRSAAEAAETEINVQRKDAERYRWLRDTGSCTWNPLVDQWRMEPNGCDAAIDREMDRQRVGDA